MTRLLLRWAVVALCVAVWVGVARCAMAAPPPMDSDDWNTLAPFKDWVTSQHDGAGRWCCDLSDMRPVDAKIVDDHWEAHITPQHWPGETDRWVVIPAERIVPGSNPTGVPILGLYLGHVQCFSPPDGT